MKTLLPLVWGIILVVTTLRAAGLPGASTNLVWIPPGAFTMGTPTNEFPVYRSIDEGPQHPVTLTRGFWMSKYEVTQAEFQSLMGINPSRFFTNATAPVEQVTWFQAVDYGQRLTAREQLAGRIPARQAYSHSASVGKRYAKPAGRRPANCSRAVRRWP